jgi:hypothetical protein
MLYLEQFQNNRVDYLKQYRRLHSSLDRNFSLCSTQYTEKFPKIRQIQPAKIDYSRDQTLFFLSKKSTTDMVGIKIFFFYSLCCLEMFCTERKTKSNVDLINYQVKCVVQHIRLFCLEHRFLFA